MSEPIKTGDHLEKDVHFTLKDPHGWIQFKGTEICIDIYCKCGEHTHFDGDFMYFVKCGACGQIYEANGYIQLIPRDSADPGMPEPVVSK